MGTKRNPAPNDCYTKAEDDEPMFTLLARDPLAADLVREWAGYRLDDTDDDDERGREKVDEAYRCADAMDAWRKANRT